MASFTKPVDTKKHARIRDLTSAIKTLLNVLEADPDYQESYARVLGALGKSEADVRECERTINLSMYGAYTFVDLIDEGAKILDTHEA